MASSSNIFNFSNLPVNSNLGPNLSSSSNQTNIKDIKKCGWLNLESFNNNKSMNYSKIKNSYQKLWTIFYILNKK